MKLREQGKLQAVLVPRSPHKLFLELLKEYIDKHPDSTLAEIAKHFNCGSNAVFNALRKLGYTYRKNNKSIKKETNQKRTWFTLMNQALIRIYTENMHEHQEVKKS